MKVENQTNMIINYPEKLEYEKPSKKQLAKVNAIVNSIAKVNKIEKNSEGVKFTTIVFEFKPNWASEVFTFEYSHEKIKSMPKWLISGFISGYEDKILTIKEIQY